MKVSCTLANAKLPNVEKPVQVACMHAFGLPTVRIAKGLQFDDPCGCRISVD